MPTKDDGGPAFPRPLDPYPNLQEQRHGEQGGPAGLSLRDWFAGQALAGILGDGSFSLGSVELAYRMADAMLAQRKAR